jgi:hypothetical protein
MKCAALTGISPELIRDLRAGRPRTLEFQSTQNILTIANIDAGPDVQIFLTSTDADDLGPGDTGICVDLLSSSISMKRMVEYAQGVYYEERERMSARVQVKYCFSSTVREVFREKLCAPTFVEVLRSSCYHAG